MSSPAVIGAICWRWRERVALPGLDELDAALGELRAAGWPAPEDPGGDDDAELDARELIADRVDRVTPLLVSFM
jgi:hypothetical protein